MEKSLESKIAEILYESCKHTCSPSFAANPCSCYDEAKNKPYCCADLKTARILLEKFTIEEKNTK